MERYKQLSGNRTLLIEYFTDYDLTRLGLSYGTIYRMSISKNEDEKKALAEIENTILYEKPKIHTIKIISHEVPKRKRSHITTLSISDIAIINGEVHELEMELSKNPGLTLKELIEQAYFTGF